MHFIEGIFVSLGFVVFAIIVAALITGWATAIDRAYERRQDARFNEDVAAKVRATRELMFWIFIPVTFPFVLLFLLGKAIVVGIKKFVGVLKDLKMPVEAKDEEELV